MLLLLLLAAKSLQSCPTVLPDRPAAHQPPGSLGFSRQEHWSGLPFPSPMHESEVVSDPQRPHGLQPTRLLCPWDFLGTSTGVECHCFLLKMCGIQLMHCLEGKVQLKCLNQKKEIHQVRLTVSSISFSVIGG